MSPECLLRECSSQLHGGGWTEAPIREISSRGCVLCCCCTRCLPEPSDYKHFSLAIDAVDRIVSFRATESSAREALLNQQIACRNQAYEFGIDPPESRTGSGRCKRRSG
jgi:hypothetical protein